MQNKPKSCKGTGIAKGSGCGKLSNNRKYGLCPTCKIDWAMNTEKGKEWLKKQTAYKMKSNEKEKKKEDRLKKSLNVDWGKKLQTEINSIVRTIDKGLTCLARNQRGQIHAGHIFARGGNQTIRYNLHNIHRQSAQSNHHQNDDGLLREGLKNEYGEKYFEFISELRQTPALEFSNSEFRDITKKARVVLKDLKEQDKIYSLSERIEMRNRINIELKIYDKKYLTFNK